MHTLAIGLRAKPLRNAPVQRMCTLVAPQRDALQENEQPIDPGTCAGTLYKKSNVDKKGTHTAGKPTQRNLERWAFSK